MSNKLIVSRLKGAISEYIALDNFTKGEAEKAKDYKAFIDKCQIEKPSYKEVKDDLEKYFISQGNFTSLKDDVFIQASRVVEVANILNLLGEDVELSDVEMQVLQACREFTKPTFFVEDGEVKNQSNEFKEQLLQLAKELNTEGNSIQKEYEALINK